MTTVFSISSALFGLPPDIRSGVQNELTNLSNELMGKYYLTLRDDSRLGWAFATGTLPPEWTRQKVMDEICFMHYLHNYTQYETEFKHVIPTVKQSIENELFAGLPKSSFYSFEYVRKFVIPLFRIRSMLNACPYQNFPKIWPWVLQHEQDESPNNLEEIISDKEFVNLLFSKQFFSSQNDVSDEQLDDDLTDVGSEETY